MASRNQLTTFESLLQSRFITQTEFDIFDAETQDHIQGPADIKDVMRRFFTLYGINPAVQFSDINFKEQFVSEVYTIIRRYYPKLSSRSFELAIELNLTNYFGLDKKPEVYGDRVNANFFIEVINVYMSRKGKIMQKLERMLPPEEIPVDQEQMDREVMAMLQQDIIAGQEGTLNLRMPDIYYELLVRKGMIQETDDMINTYISRAKQIVSSMKEIAKRKENAPLSLKELDITRQFISKSGKNVISIAKQEAVIDYINSTKQLQ